MRFVRADRLKAGDTALLARDDVDELFAHIVSAIEHKDRRIHFVYTWRHGKDHGREEKVLLPHERCLLIRRPKRRSKKARR